MKALIVGNWKMHPHYPEDARELLVTTRKALMRADKISVVLAPPSVFLADLAGRTRARSIQFAVQNVHWEKEGAFTGEISVLQAKAVGASYVIVGHAERRRVGETDADVARKVGAVMAAGSMKAIVCVGETSRDDSGAFLSVLSEQVRASLAEVTPERLSRIVIAYEPVWAIGAPEPMTPHDMHEMTLYIRKVLMQQFGDGAARVPILYGGAIDAESAPRMLQEGDVQGFLVGRASIGKIQWSNMIAAAQSA